MPIRKYFTITIFFVFIIINPATANKVSNNDCNKIWNQISFEWQNSDSVFNQLYGSLKNQCGEKFKKSLQKLISKNTLSSYSNSRKFLFEELHLSDNLICGVYTNICYHTNQMPNANLLNCEHTWPQSHGASHGVQKADLHHLFPATPEVNSRRSNHPFCKVSNSTWEGSGSILGYSNEGTFCFEPRDDHKRRVAFAMFYFSIRFSDSINDEEESYLRNWAMNFEEDSFDLLRNDMIEEFQGNRNPFIDVPKFVLLIDDF